jgi:hypothetical protein
MKESDDDAITLQIYRAPDGQWSGKLFSSNDEEVGSITGCDSPEAVEQAARDSGIFPYYVLVQR